MPRESFNDYITVVDVETTGTNPNKNSIVSIGAVDFHKPSNQFYEECRIFEGAEINPIALSINGFSKEQITDTNKHPLKETMNNFVKWCKPNTIFAGENPSFDFNFLKDSFDRYGLKWIFGYRTVDIHTLTYEQHLKHDLTIPTVNGKPNINLDVTLNFVGLPNEPKPHNALTGAKLEAEALCRLLYAKKLLKEFEKYSLS